MKRLVAIMALLPMLVAVGHTTPGRADARPNVVIIITDDQRWDMVTQRFMPNVTAQLMPYAIQGFVPNSLCCPSRTSILTGNYSHTTGVWDNEGQQGGFRAFDDKHTIAVDFETAGYRTAMLGKYLNGYNSGSTTYVPPGWTRWFALQGGDYYNYDATLRLSPGSHVRTPHYGHREDDYSTNVLRRQTMDFLASVGTNPFFLYLSWTAPHKPAIPSRRDIGRFAGDPDNTFGSGTSMLDAAYGADRATGKILAALPANTIVVFMSDNGYLWGEHGLTGKGLPYEEATRVPFAIRGITPVETTLAANVDLRPTLDHAAGVPMLTHADGIDLTALTRDDLVLEHYGEHNGGVRSYCGVRTPGWMYTRYDNGEQLLFDLSSDYAEDVNLVDTQPAKAAALRARARELCSPAPPGYAW